MHPVSMTSRPVLLFEASVAQVEAILTAERLKRDRQAGLGDFVRAMGVSQ